ncbi:hypothetical protein AMIS_64650 [Actinoplanes missouriensis 431]|uniref:Flavin reductase n=1 Tax=Actinoplanes missouriensis (strain ATCC 14538 / DSM 43046 / CBS 188.64 / JCM 3121 / NBRC 102363 / NCIMB 12654 / NRRL B-3342 / UNCC 431) TaxID=512565 RepID=I0HF98_ACTM4|nr:hypothetical protein [Actinoplanes missouriensis]BAL91685.1 hypothetical protein AMIS_64650 [Actinoplanes missouriensis 431]
MSMTGGEAEHAPAQPSWKCESCGLPWPCPPARDRLTRENGRVELAVLMWDYIEEAARDMPQSPASELFDRFLRWTD